MCMACCCADTPESLSGHFKSSSSSEDSKIVRSESLEYSSSLVYEDEDELEELLSLDEVESGGEVTAVASSLLEVSEGLEGELHD